MDRVTLLAGMEFGRNRLLATLASIEKSGLDAAKVLAWRPGVGRAHIAWQAMHCAATHDKYLHVGILGSKPTDEALVATYGGGSTPSDQNIPDLSTIRQALEKHYTALRDYVAGEAVLDQKGPNGRTVAESILLLTWHEAHHQGQIHLTLNLFKAANGIA